MTLSRCALAAAALLYAAAWGLALYAAITWRGWWLLTLTVVAPSGLVGIGIIGFAAMCARSLLHHRYADRQFIRFMRNAGADDVERTARQLLADKAGRQ